MNTPKDIFITGDDGLPTGHIDFDRLTLDATLFMYDMAVAAGDDEATDQVAAKWLSTCDSPDYFGYLAASTLSLLTRNILGPVLDATDAAGMQLRRGLQRAAADAARDLGGQQ